MSIQKDLLKNISPPLGVSQFKQSISTKISPPLGVLAINKHSPSGGSPLASGSFPMAEKWKECRCPVRWDWPWNAFKKFSIKRENFEGRYSRQQGILVHVRMTVRKAILNEPKPFGYFWASKVTKRIGICELLRRFGYFGLQK